MWAPTRFSPACLITACLGAQQGSLLARHRRAESRVFFFFSVFLFPLLFTIFFKQNKKFKQLKKFLQKNHPFRNPEKYLKSKPFRIPAEISVSSSSSKNIKKKLKTQNYNLKPFFLKKTQKLQRTQYQSQTWKTSTTQKRKQASGPLACGVGGCTCRYSYGCVGVRACGRTSVLVSGCLFFWLKLYFFLVHTCLLFTVSTTRAATPFTLITAHHDRIPSQPYGYFSFFLSLSHRAWTRVPLGHRRRLGGVPVCAAR